MLFDGGAIAVRTMGVHFAGFLLAVFTAISVIGEELVVPPSYDPPRIYPDLHEYVVDSGQNLTLRCEGKQPLTWVLPENQEMDDLKEASSIISVSETPDSEYPFGLLLELFHVSPMDVGYYTCKFNNTVYDEELNTEELEAMGKAKSIYVYVHDPDILIVPMVTFISGIQYSSITIPCRPSSPDVTVKLFRDDDEGDLQLEVGRPLPKLNNRSLTYDRRSGFELPELDIDDASYMYRCEHQRGNKVDNSIVVLSVSTHTVSAPKPHINDSSYGHAVIGGEISLDCYVRIDKGVPFQFDWSIPDKEAFRQNRVVITNTTTKNEVLANKNVGRSSLTLRNVTLNDQGIYKCQIRDVNNHKNHDQKAVTVLEKGHSVIKLTEPVGKYSLEVNAGMLFVQWVIEIQAYPLAQITWYDNQDREVTAGWSDNHSKKYEVIISNENTKLRINQITLADSGVYTVKAVNEYESKSVNLTLVVKAKPVVEMPPQKFHLYGTIVSELCNVVGYPPPEVKWTFRPCIGQTDCQSVKEEVLPKNKYTTRTESSSKVKSLLSITASKSGYITCTATNSLGSHQATTTFLVTDVEGGFGIYDDSFSSSSGLEVTLGDNVSLTCAASLYNYTDDLSWYRMPNMQPISTNDSEVTILNRRSVYSNQAVLTIRDIQKHHDGEYLCKATEIKLQSVDNVKYDTRQVYVKVSDPSVPIIVDSNIKNEDQSVLLGEPNVKFFCNFIGKPYPSIQWLKNDMPWTPSNSSNERVSIENESSAILFKYVKDGDEGKYSCEVTNKVGKTSRYVNLILKNKSVFKASYIAIIAAILILCIIVIIYLFWRIRREMRIRKQLSLAGLLNFEEGQTNCLNPELGVDEQAELLPYDRKWEFPREKLKLGKQLGSGAFGVVMKADAYGILDAEEMTTVAVKMVKKTAEPAYIKALASELKIMVHLGKHLNVVNLLGACTKNVVKRELLVIVEYCQYGNIHNYLLRHRNVYIDQVDHTTGSIDPAIGVINRAFSESSKSRLKDAALSFFNSGRQPEPDYRDNLQSGATAQTTLNSGGTAVSMAPQGEDSMNECGQNSSGSVQPEWRSNYRGDYTYSAAHARPLCTRDLLCWAFQVARGMDYLAQRKVLHGDLAARNILLADDNIVKICDFGLAKSMYKSDNYRKKGDGPLPVKWMAIESIRDRIFSTQSDVWSFGIVLWELFSLARTPYPGMAADEKLYNKLIEGYRMEKPCYANNEIYEVMLDCWRAKPVQRPSFSELETKLGGLLEEAVRSHYIDLNSPYLEMNNAWLAEKGQDNDYLAMMNAPDYGNLVSPSGGRDYVNAPFGGPVTVNIQSPEETDAEGYLCMSPAKSSAMYSPNTSKADMFDFKTPPAQTKWKATPIAETKDNQTELIPMLSKDNKPARGSESDSEIPSPTGFQPNLKIVTENPKNSPVNHANNDNYVNMSHQNNGKNDKVNDAFSNPSYIIMDNPKTKTNDVQKNHFVNSTYVN